MRCGARAFDTGYTELVATPPVFCIPVYVRKSGTPRETYVNMKMEELQDRFIRQMLSSLEKTLRPNGMDYWK